MTHASSSDDFDWVSAQSKCSAADFFERLKTGVRGDVERRSALLPSGARERFEFFEDDDGHFEVTRGAGSSFGAPKLSAVVRFERIGRRIEVSGEDIDVSLTAVLALDPEGHCRVVVGEALYAEWEFRRMALELLFFQEEEHDEP